MGGKARPRRQQVVWLSRNHGGSVVHVWSGASPVLHADVNGRGFWWCVPGLGKKLGEFDADAINITVDVTRPVRVLLLAKEL